MGEDVSTGFEEIAHTGDVALRVWGRDLAEVFVSAARGMAWLLVGPADVALAADVALELSAGDAETLLVSWLGELLYLYERDGVMWVDFDVEDVTPTHLRGVAHGGPVDEPNLHIKAVTFSEMDIRHGPRGLETMVVFDV